MLFFTLLEFGGNLFHNFKVLIQQDIMLFHPQFSAIVTYRNSLPHVEFLNISQRMEGFIVRNEKITVVGEIITKFKYLFPYEKIEVAPHSMNVDENTTVVCNRDISTIFFANGTQNTAVQVKQDIVLIKNTINDIVILIGSQNITFVTPIKLGDDVLPNAFKALGVVLFIGFYENSYILWFNVTKNYRYGYCIEKNTSVLSFQPDDGPAQMCVLEKNDLFDATSFHDCFKEITRTFEFPYSIKISGTLFELSFNQTIYKQTLEGFTVEKKLTAIFIPNYNEKFTVDLITYW